MIKTEAGTATRIRAGIFGTVAGLAALGVLTGLLWLPRLEALPGAATLAHMPAAALRVDMAGRPALPQSALPQASEASTMLVVGGALVGFGLVGRKRRAAKAAESR